MPSPPRPFTAEHWRRRAEEARAVAAQMKDDKTRRIMLGIADSYEHLAGRAETFEAAKPNSQ